MKRVGLLFSMGYFAFAGVAQAATYYVSKTGSDNNSCAAAQSTSTPRLTINAGIRCLTAGDTLFVRSGTYAESIRSVPSGTSWSSKVRIANYNGETVWVKPATSTWAIFLDGNFSYVEFDGINTDGTNASGELSVISFSTNNGYNPHHIRYKNATVIAGAIGSSGAITLGNHTKIGATGAFEIQKVTIRGGGKSGGCGWQCNSYGIYVMGPNNLIEDCDIYDTSAMGIHLYNASGDPTDNNIIRNNRIHDIKRTGTPGQYIGILYSGSNNQIYNNLIYNIGPSGSGNGIDGFSNSTSGNKVWNNTIYSVGQYGIKINSGVSNTEVRNNIAYNNPTNFSNTGSGTVESNNLFGANPLFVNPSANNFELEASSPAIDRGTALSAVQTDFAGVSRPQGSTSDIGAHEFRGQAAPGPPAPPTGVRIVSN
jgi:hypothetical protein